MGGPALACCRGSKEGWHKHMHWRKGKGMAKAMGMRTWALRCARLSAQVCSTKAGRRAGPPAAAAVVAAAAG